MQKLIQKIIAHKLISAIVAIAFIWAGWSWYHTYITSKTTVNYTTTPAVKGTLITSITGSGQVASSNQFDIKPKVSGDVVSVAVTEGQSVKSGTLLFKIDSTDAEKALRDAQTNLETAKLSLAKLTQPADDLSILQAENALIQAEQSKQQATDNLKKAYDDGFNAVSDAFLDLPSLINGMQTMLFASNSSLGSGGQWVIDYYADITKIYDDRATQYRDDTYAKYQAARTAYDQNFADYKAASRFSDPAAIEALINETYNTTKSLAEAITSGINFIQFYEDKLVARGLKPNALADTQIAALNTYTSKVNSHLGDLLGITQTIKNSNNALMNSTQSIAEKTESLAKLKNGPDPLDVRSSQISVDQRQNALIDAQQKLNDYYIRAPFDGVVAKIISKKGTSAGSGSSMATFITNQQLAQIAVNEVDVAKVKIGQKATIAFDAIPDLSIAGEVTAIDTIGTITQGVVTYNVTVAFDTQDARVKSGMSITISVITNVKPDVILVPNSAVKTSGGAKYVQFLVNGQPENHSVVVGDENDTMTEITSGVNVGDAVITRTTTSGGSAATAPSGNSSIRIPGITGGGTGGGAGTFRGGTTGR